jgi:hypothetical protein
MTKLATAHEVTNESGDHRDKRHIIPHTGRLP